VETIDVLIQAMLSAEQLSHVLNAVPGATDVVAGREDSKLIALVVSTDFVGKQEHERQSLVWQLILANLSDAEQADIGYVFTNTPEEKAEAQAQGEAQAARA